MSSIYLISYVFYYLHEKDKVITWLYLESVRAAIASPHLTLIQETQEELNLIIIYEDDQSVALGILH